MIFSSRSSGNCCDIFVFWRSTSLFRFMNRVHHPLETRKLSIFIYCAVFLACKRIRFLVTASPHFLFSLTHSTTFFSSSGHWHFLPRSAHLVFGRDFMLSIFLLQSWTNFSSMPNFRSFLFSLGPIRASCVMSRFSSHAHHVIFQHGMQL